MKVIKLLILGLALTGLTSQALAKPSFKVFGYLPNYSVNGPTGVNINANLNTPAAFPWQRMTHVMEAFAIPNAAGNGIEWNGTVGLQRPGLIAAAHSNNTRVMLSLGGADPTGSLGLATRWRTATNTTNIAAFVADIMNKVQTFGYDGIDVDWEFPNAGNGMPSETAQFMDLMQRLYNAHHNSGDVNWKGNAYDGQQRHLTFFISPGYDICGVTWSQIGARCDYGILGGYDFNTPFNGPTSDATAMTRCNNVSAAKCITSTVSYLTVTNSFPINKLVLAMPMYSQLPTPNGTALLTILKNGTRGTFYTPQDEESWTYNSTTHYLDVAQSYCRKMTWAFGTKGMPGIALWSINMGFPQNDGNAELTKIWQTIEGDPVGGCTNLPAPCLTCTSSCPAIPAGLVDFNDGDNVNLWGGNWALGWVPAGSTGLMSVTVTGYSGSIYVNPPWGAPCAAGPNAVRFAGNAADPGTGVPSFQSALAPAAGQKDVSAYNTISFWMRATAGSFRFVLDRQATRVTGGNDHYGVNITVAAADANVWKQYTFFYSDLAQAGWGGVVAPGWTDVISLAWMPTSMGNYEMILDDVEFKYTPPTPTPTRTPSFTLTPTPSFSPSFTRSATLSPSATPSVTPSNSPANSPTSSYSASATRSATPTFSPVNSPSSSATSSGTRSSTLTFTSSPTLASTFTASNSATASPTRSATLSPSATSTGSPTRSATRTLSATPSISPTPTDAPAGSTATVTPSISPTFTRSPTPTPTSSATSSASPTRSASPSMTSTMSPSATASISPTYSASQTFTSGPSPTFSMTFTSGPSPTFSASSSATPSPSATSSGSRTATRSATPTFSFSVSPTRSPTPQGTSTHSPTQSATSVASPSVTPSATRTATALPSNTHTVSPTLTPTYPPDLLDNFADANGTSLWGGYWNSNANSGLNTMDFPPAFNASGYPSSPFGNNSALLVNGTNAGGASAPRGNLSVGLTNMLTAVDVSAYGGVGFWFYGSSPSNTYKMYAHRSATGNWDDYGITFTAPANQWTYINLDFDLFAQDGWGGSPVAAAWNDVISLYWVTPDDGAYSMSLDDVRFLPKVPKSPTPTITVSATQSPTQQPTIADEGENRISSSAAAPNPNPVALLAKLEGRVDEVSARIYSSAYVLVGEIRVKGGLTKGWAGLPLSQLSTPLGTGLWHYHIQAYRNGQANPERSIGSFVILK